MDEHPKPLFSVVRAVGRRDGERTGKTDKRQTGRRKRKSFLDMREYDNVKHYIVIIIIIIA